MRLDVLGLDAVVGRTSQVVVPTVDAQIGISEVLVICRDKDVSCVITEQSFEPNDAGLQIFVVGHGHVVVDVGAVPHGAVEPLVRRTRVGGVAVGRRRVGVRCRRVVVGVHVGAAVDVRAVDRRSAVRGRIVLAAAAERQLDHYEDLHRTEELVEKMVEHRIAFRSALKERGCRFW